VRTLISSLPMLTIAAGVGLVLILALGSRPRAFAVVWLLTIAFVPWWVGVKISTFVPAAALICLLALLCMIPMLATRVTIPDWGVLSFFVVCLIPVFLGGGSKSATFGVAVIWLPAYLVGRRLPARVDLQWLYGCVAVIFSTVSFLAIIEFLFAWNPFVNIHFGSGASYATWGSLQRRGGVLRAEGAFGHSIALGSSLALAIPMTLASRFPVLLRVGAAGLMLGATVVTFSRTGILCAALGLILSILFVREGLSRRLRQTVIALVVVMAGALLPFVNQTFNAAGSEATRSADYRSELTSLIPRMSLTGISDATQRLANGDVYFGNFRSIDSQLILTGVSYGSLAMLIGVFLLLAGIWLLLARRATPPMISVVCQIPSLATVALITQYSVFFWFTVGLAVAAQAARSATAELEAESTAIESAAVSSPLADARRYRYAAP
jgi:hypothetical protein